MATINIPSIRTVITGDGLTALDKITTFTLSEKMETVRLLKASDGSVAIDIAYINTLKTLYIESTGVFTVTITHTTTDVIPVVNTIPFEINGGVFRLDPTVASRALLSAITLSTASTTDITINIRAYGVAA